MFGSSFFFEQHNTTDPFVGTPAQSLAVEEDVAAEFDAMLVNDLGRAQWRQHFRA